MLSASVKLYDTTIGAVAWDAERELGIFQYAEDFLQSGIELSPIHLPLRSGTFVFPELTRESFKGLPGLLADCLPDKFGNLLIDQWLSRQNRTPESFTPVERLCYLGTRAMGALEFEPSSYREGPAHSLEIDALVELANAVLADKNKLHTKLTDNHEEQAIADILRVGTSAGGARAKAVISWNPQTGDIRSGQTTLKNSYEPWLLKFDGVSGNADKELADPMGYGRIEYAYHQMAKIAGIEMNPCHLLEENGRAHFMTKRFDRSKSGDKLHMQTLCALGHYDFNLAGGYSYEQTFQLARRIGCGANEIEELYRRAAFNILARNQDDHTKNISFLMDRRGKWSLAPAYDVTYSYNPSGAWTSRHQMTFNGKREHFTHEDFYEVAKAADLKKRQTKEILDRISEAIKQWNVLAPDTGIDSKTSKFIAEQFRMI